MTSELCIGLKGPCPPDPLSLPKPVLFTTFTGHKVTNNAEMPSHFPNCGNSPQESDEACLNSICRSYLQRLYMSELNIL